MTTSPTPTDFTWVDAAPFRAHARYLLESTQISVTTLARLSGIPEQFLLRLLTGRSARSARPLLRVPPDLAATLFQLTPGSLRLALRAERGPRLGETLAA